MKDYFKNSENNRLFHLWLSLFPESYHTLDMNRFYNFILSLFTTNEELTKEILMSAVKEEKKWNEDRINTFVDEFIERYFELKRFWEFARVHYESDYLRE